MNPTTKHLVQAMGLKLAGEGFQEDPGDKDTSANDLDSFKYKYPEQFQSLKGIFWEQVI